jgi:transposase
MSCLSKIDGMVASRLSGRLRAVVQHLRQILRGKNVNIAAVAVARELAGFIWDISRLAMALAVPRDARYA